MLVPVEAGMNHVQISFIRTWDRTLGGWISLLTVTALVIWTLLLRRRGVGLQTSDIGPQTLDLSLKGPMS
jgi:hypothetical protein